MRWGPHAAKRSIEESCHAFVPELLAAGDAMAAETDETLGVREAVSSKKYATNSVGELIFSFISSSARSRSVLTSGLYA